ncbi:MAG: hypothetical protein ABH857_03170 [Elusimicrobiota bacterium]
MKKCTWKRKIIGAILVCSIFLSSANIVYASHYVGHSEISAAPTILDYGKQGFGIGLVLGCAAGYLKYNSTKEKKDLVKGPAYGALIGTLVCIGVGIYDLNQDKSGIGEIILHDIHGGAYLGMLLGTCLGLVTVIDSEDGNDIAKGAAWGAFGGAAVGLLLGLYEGPRILEKYAYNPKDNIPVLWVKETGEGQDIALGVNFIRAVF